MYEFWCDGITYKQSGNMKSPLYKCSPTTFCSLNVSGYLLVTGYLFVNRNTGWTSKKITPMHLHKKKVMLILFLASHLRSKIKCIVKLRQWCQLVFFSSAHPKLWAHHYLQNIPSISRWPEGSYLNTRVHIQLGLHFDSLEFKDATETHPYIL